MQPSTMLACLVVAVSASTAAQARRGALKYACEGGQCVPNSRGLPLAECQAVCAPSPSANYSCTAGQCVVSGRGLPKAKCTQVCGGPGPAPAPGGKTIVDLAVATPDLSTLVTALKAGDLVGTLSGRGPFTVFAPTNEAFTALPFGVLANLLKPENKAQLDDVLTYHVVAGDVQAKDLKDGERIKTVEGKTLVVRLSGGDVFINSAKVTTADVNASNGVVHIIDRVLLPAGGPAPPPGPGPSPPPGPGPDNNIVQLAASVPDLSTLVTALKAAQLTTDLSGAGPFTVFAPTNEAFKKLPKATLARLLDPANIKELQGLLEYHVASGSVYSKDLTDKENITTLEGQSVEILLNARGPGSGVFISDGETNGVTDLSRVTKADNSASNGVVHLIDTVLNPPAAPLPPGSSVALVPLPGCTAVQKAFCFQGPQQSIEGFLKADKLACKPPEQATLRSGSCSQYGFGKDQGKDPFFKDVERYRA